MSLYKPTNSENWWVDIRHAGQRVRRTTGTPDRAAAQKRHNDIQVELWALVPDTPGATWGKAVELWCNARTRNDAELLSLAKFGRGFPDRALSAVTREAVHEALAFTVAVSTYTRYRAMILSILNLARKEGWIDKVPDLTQKKERKKASKMWLTPAQWLDLKAELPPHLRVMAEFAIETGLRQSNVLQLRWAQLSVERRIVWIEADEMKGNVAHTVPLNAAALAVLAGQQGQHAEFVFTYDGRAISEIKTAFIKACVRAKLGAVTVSVDAEGDTHRNYTGFTWHGLRHTWATWHAQNGTPLHALKELGGWSDLRMVMTYAHHSPTHLAGYADNNRKTT